MAEPFPIVRRFDYPKFEAVTAADGIRVYVTPEGEPAPSVTTILSTLPKPGIDAWRARVGDKEANRVTKEATDIGSNMHDMLEGYVSAFLQGRPDVPPKTDYERMAWGMSLVVRQYGLAGSLEEVWGIEEALYCHALYAGRTDLIGVYEGKSSIIDYKTTRRPKPEAWIENYKMQIAAYAVAHEEMFGVDAIDQGVILMAVRPDSKSGKVIQRFIINKSDMTRYKSKWMQVVEEFHRSLN